MAWLTNWDRYKEVNLGAMDVSAQTNLNYRITVNYETLMQSEFQDVRFTDSDGETLLDQYREPNYVASSIAYFWIKVPSVPAAGKTLRMYYGNDAASLVSSGADTLPFFDEFTGDNGDPPDVSKWTVSDNAYVQIQSNDLRIQITWSHLTEDCTSIDTLGVGYGVRVRLKRVKSGLGLVKVGWKDKHYYSADNTTFKWYYNNGSPVDAVDLGDDEWHAIEIHRVSATTLHCYFDNALHTQFLGASVTDSLEITIDYAGANPSGDVTVSDLQVFKLPQDGTVPTHGVGIATQQAGGCVSWSRKLAQAAAWTLLSVCDPANIIPTGSGLSEQVHYHTGSKIKVFDTGGGGLSEQTFYDSSTKIKVTEVSGGESEQAFYGTGTTIKVRSV